MKAQKHFSREKMRYAVPGVSNRFFAVHAPVIALCAALSVIVIAVTLAAVVIFGVQELEPKMSLVFYCEVDDIELVRENSVKHGNTFDIYFAEYGDVVPEDDTDNLAAAGVAAALYGISGTRREMYTYAALGLDKGAALGWADVERIIAAAREDI